jgi:hypothetical protein
MLAEPSTRVDPQRYRRPASPQLLELATPTRNEVAASADVVMTLCADPTPIQQKASDRLIIDPVLPGQPSTRPPYGRIRRILRVEG